MPKALILTSKPTLAKAVDLLCKSLTSGTFKVRWNACHCFKLLFSNKDFPMGGSAPYTHQIYTSLQKAAIESTNFKVRTGAITSFSTPSQLYRYQTMQSDAKQTIKSCLESCIKSIETLDNALARSSHDDRMYLDQFFAAINNSVIVFKDIFKTNGIQWNSDFELIEQTLIDLESKARLPPKSITE